MATSGAPSLPWKRAHPVNAPSTIRLLRGDSRRRTAITDGHAGSGSHPMRSIVRLMVLLALSGTAAMVSPGLAAAQDVPGIENCMAEKQIERRTGCLQSNINYLKSAV